MSSSSSSRINKILANFVSSYHHIGVDVVELLQEIPTLSEGEVEQWTRLHGERSPSLMWRLKFINTSLSYSDVYNLMRTSPNSVIFCPLKPKNSKMFHFIVLDCERRCWFDSIGCSSEYIFSQWGFIMPSNWRAAMGGVQLQNPFWDVCGFWCIYFILFDIFKIYSSSSSSNVNTFLHVYNNTVISSTQMLRQLYQISSHL